jgi:hypothetical protein
MLRMAVASGFSAIPGQLRVRNAGIASIPYAYRLPHLPVCSTTVDPATARQLTASAGMLQLASDAPYMPGLLLDDGRPQLLDAPVTGKIM